MHALLKQLIPDPVKAVLTGWRERRIQQQYGALPISEAFERVYNSNAWGVSEDGSLYSGDGSDQRHVCEYLPVILDVLKKHQVGSVADLGCGNFNTGRMIASEVGSYVGVDIAEPVISVNNRNYASDRVRFIRADLTRDPLPPADAAIVRQVFQHLSNEETSRALENILGAYPLVVITEHVYTGRGMRPNLDIAHGPGTRVPMKSGVFIDQPPFSLKASLAGDIVCGKGGTEAVRTWVIETRGASSQRAVSPSRSGSIA